MADLAPPHHDREGDPSFFQAAFDKIAAVFGSAEMQQDADVAFSSNVSRRSFRKMYCGNSSARQAPLVARQYARSWPVVRELNTEEPAKVGKKNRNNAFQYNRSFATPLRFTIRHLLRATFEASVGEKAEEAEYGYSDWWFNAPEYAQFCMHA